MKNHRLIPLTSLILVLALLFSAFSCTSAKDVGPAASESVAAAPAVTAFVPNDNDIVILYTNDIHCGIDSGIGFAGLVSYRDSVRGETPYVLTVDCGDAIQGEAIGVVSKGGYIIDIMNKCGYDIGIIGNHGFGYGIDQLTKLLSMAEYPYLATNMHYSGSRSETPLTYTKPYIIREFGNKKVAFIGVLATDTIFTITPSLLMEDDALVWSFDSTEEELARTVQAYVDECRAAGADYVVLLTHLGIQEAPLRVTSLELIAGTEGVDVVLDAHSHNIIPELKVANKNGDDVLLSSTGTKFQNIGRLTISRDGVLSTGLVSEWEGRDEAITAYIAEIKTSYEATMKQVAANIDIAMSISREDGTRAVRNSETAIGNLVADAYRTIAGTDIALVNGGGIRDNLSEGDVTFEDIIKVHPFGNYLTAVKATGRQILDSLELSCVSTQNVSSADGTALGESGGFQSVSGLKFTIDTSIPSSVVLDENGVFLKVDGERRVKDVLFLKDGSWTALDPDAEYSVASHNFMLKEGGDGFSMFKGDELLIDAGMLDYQVLLTYITDILGGKLAEKYSAPEGRITIK